MEIALRLPRVLQQHGDGKPELRVPGTTVRDVLEELKRRYPSLYQCICDETGAVRQHVSLFVNNDFLPHRNGLDTRLESGDVLSVFQAVSGG